MIILNCNAVQPITLSVTSNQFQFYSTGTCTCSFGLPMDPVNLPPRPVTGGLATALIMGAALSSPSKLSRRSLLGLSLFRRT